MPSHPSNLHPLISLFLTFSKYIEHHTSSLIREVSLKLPTFHPCKYIALSIQINQYPWLGTVQWPSNQSPAFNQEPFALTTPIMPPTFIHQKMETHTSIILMESNGELDYSCLTLLKRRVPFLMDSKKASSLGTWELAIVPHSIWELE